MVKLRRPFNCNIHKLNTKKKIVYRLIKTNDDYNNTEEMHLLL